MNQDPIIIVIGVSGVGKTTIAQSLAKKFQIAYIEADDYHPEDNIAKMKNGKSLNDADRMPWLAALNQKIKETESDGLVLACSALKEIYRTKLAESITNKIHWVILDGEYEVILNRMQERQHFMPPELLKSQFKDWEMPAYGIKININTTPDLIVEQVYKKITMDKKSDIGLIGLGVMGKSLCRNIARNGFSLSVFNRHLKGVEENVAKDFVADYEELKSTQPFDNLPAFVESLATPRKVYLMVSAGAAVDEVINQLTPLLQKNDIIIDGGNSHYKKTEQRFENLKKHGIRYIGTGVSGGEAGALNGPSIMPGGSLEAYKIVSPILEKIAAKDKSGASCCKFIGKGGSGHFVKMVHNGIEYGEMQLIAEVYGFLRFQAEKNPAEIAELFKKWNQTECASYLLEITADILQHKEGDAYLIDIILDKAGNKGTGGWTTIAAAELGVAIPTLTAALFARYQSAQHAQRQKSAPLYTQTKPNISISTEDLRHAYQLARIINHHQGYDLISTASATYGWEINLQNLSRIWTQGCIIRSKLMEEMGQYDYTEPSLLMQSSLQKYVVTHREKLNEVVAKMSSTNVSTPCLSSSLSYLKAYTESRSLANVIQAQRDYFGAHTYERLDKKQGTFFHTKWT